MSDVSAAEGIRQLHARFIDAVWRQDAESFVQCFTEDGEWKVGGMHLKGRESIGPTFAKLLGLNERVLITPGLPILEIDGDSAIGRCQGQEIAKLPDGSSVMTLGVYYDRYTLSEGLWRFRWRHFALHYRGPLDLSAPMVESPEFGPFPGMPEWDEPTLTRRTEPLD
ncbi:nuclear transport factor 2 family protein [Mangrovimicrobium sediminis]|uniref:Nuclear transport factor 2 family protein n=1 Tax=Mangrovimicrobium sediminis TaxID=2562682 RepID=A0A4Z0LUX3_9GAMM|nr:nuclear transport factor 2 family protein [Haliea sp. SAOS-164]TGD71054.1 nuclear transport factor 2 family protein [Haliea sp. SAOS-164]